jgi:hypothetical protein
MIRRTLPLWLLWLSACSGMRVIPEVVELDRAPDVLVGNSPMDEVVSGWPTTFLIGDARDVTRILEARTDLADRVLEGEVVTVVDGSGLGPLDLAPVEEILVEAALEDGGAILLDTDGSLSRNLSGVAQRPTLVRLSEERVVLTRVALDDPNTELRAAALGAIE